MTAPLRLRWWSMTGSEEVHIHTQRRPSVCDVGAMVWCAATAFHASVSENPVHLNLNRTRFYRKNKVHIIIAVSGQYHSCRIVRILFRAWFVTSTLIFFQNKSSSWTDLVCPVMWRAFDLPINQHKRRAQSFDWHCFHRSSVSTQQRYIFFGVLVQTNKLTHYIRNKKSLRPKRKTAGTYNNFNTL